MKKILFIILLMFIISLCIACSTNNDDGELYEKAINNYDISLDYTIDYENNNIEIEIEPLNAIQDLNCILKLYNNNDTSQYEFIMINYEFVEKYKKYYTFYEIQNLNNQYNRIDIHLISGLKQNNAKDLKDLSIKGKIIPKTDIISYGNNYYTVNYDLNETSLSYGYVNLKSNTTIYDANILIVVTLINNKTKIYNYKVPGTWIENKSIIINLDKESNEDITYAKMEPIIQGSLTGNKYILGQLEVDYSTYLYGSINSSNNSSNDIIGGISGPVKQPTFKEEFNQFKEEHSDIYYSIVSALITITVIIILILIYKFIKSKKKKANNNNKSLNE